MHELRKFELAHVMRYVALGRSAVVLDLGCGEEYRETSVPGSSRVSIPVGLLHPLQYAGLYRRSVPRFPLPKEEITNIRYALKRSRPYGSEPSVSKAVARFGLNTLRNPWRAEKGYLHRSP